MKISLPLSTVWCVLFVFSNASAQKVNGVKGEVELITEPRPGEEFVQIHSINGKQPNKFLKPSGSRFGQSSNDVKERNLAGNDRDIPIIPAKDKRLLRYTVNNKKHHKQQQEEEDPEIVPDFSDESAEDMNVSIVDEGKTGLEFQNADEDEREILEHKIRGSGVSNIEEKPHHEEHYDIDNVALYMESKSGIQKSDAIEENDESPVKQLSTSKPTLEKSRDKSEKKSSSDKKYDILTLNKQKNEKYGEENFDFVDSPFDDKLVSSGTSQTSRINVKKGPNGQNYEYEYIYYYYYDDDDPDNKTQPTPSAADIPSPQRTSRVTTPAPAPLQTSWRQQATPSTTTEEQRVHNTRQRGRPNDNARYTVSNVNLDLDIPTEKLSNEVLPVTSPSRFRGRASSEIPTEATPEQTSTRFPSRSRGSTSQQPQQQQFVSSTTPATFETPPSRTRGNIRRPSLELVDSSSFRTHSSDVSPDQDQKQTTKFRGEPAQAHVFHQESFTTQPQTFETQPKFQTRPAFTSQRNIIDNVPTEPLFQEQTFTNTRGNSVDTNKAQDDYRGERILDTTRESDLEEYISGTSIPAVNDISQNTLITKPRTSFDSTDRTTNTFIPNTGMPDKAAFDLYAILQQMHNEESNYLVDDNSATLDQNGLPLPVTVQFPVVQPTTTTPATTTTTTTTTTPATTTVAAVSEPAVVPGKGRFKNNLSQRNRFKTGTTSTTTEVPVEQSTLRARKFQPSQQRPQGQPSAYARRSKTSTSSPLDESQSSTSAAEESVTKSKSRFGSRNRFSSSSGSSSTTSTTPSSAQAQASVTRASSSDRFSARRRPGSRLSASSTTVSSEGSDSSSFSSDVAQSSATTPSLSPRSRLPSNNAIRPLRPGPRINIGGARGRLGASSTTPTPDESKITSEGVSPDGAASESAPQSNQEVQSEVNAESSPAEQTPSTTPDALTRLRKRPRLSPLSRPAKAQSQAAVDGASPVSSTVASPVAPNQNRRQLGGLLSRRPGQTSSTQATSPAPLEEEKIEPEIIPVEELLAQVSSSTEATQATTENKISSLISRRRTIAARRPGTLQTRSTTAQ